MEKDKWSTFSTEVTTTSQIPLLVDPISNPLNDVYAMWPERLYLVQGENIVYISQPHDDLLHETARQKLMQIL